MNFILSKIDGLFKSSGWEAQHPGRAALFIWYVTVVPAYIALMAPHLMPLAIVFGSIFWALPMSILELVRYDKDKPPEEAVSFTVWAVFPFVIGLALTIVTFPLALISVHWGRPSGMAAGTAN